MKKILLTAIATALIVSAAAVILHKHSINRQKTAYQEYIYHLENAYVSMIAESPENAQKEISAIALLRLKRIKNGTPPSTAGIVYPENFFEDSEAFLTKTFLAQGGTLRSQ